MFYKGQRLPGSGHCCDFLRETKPDGGVWVISLREAGPLMSAQRKAEPSGEPGMVDFASEVLDRPFRLNNLSSDVCGSVGGDCYSCPMSHC